MTDDPSAGDDNDKFELATFFQSKSKKVWVMSPSFFKAVFFVLSAAGVDTPNAEPVQQQLYHEQSVHPYRISTCLTDL